ncbi:MAG: carbamate kinase [Deltaproteobacteria bacterium]|nr:carbamate kinase [Deltaproteobacteria bacterium]
MHGNGPQVGYAMIKVEEAVTKIPPVTVDFCVAETQGTIGFQLENAIRNHLQRSGIKRDVVTILSEVLVDPADPNFRNPTKPVGPFYTRYRAKMLQREKRWMMVEDSGRGFRKVVPSPFPREVLNSAIIKRLFDEGHIVICGGGGGIPVVRTKSGLLNGIDAVIDKDYTASLLARETGAELLVILTSINRVFINFNTPDMMPIARIDAAGMKKHFDEGQFPAGSMGPKIDACLKFLESGGSAALITSEDSLRGALAFKNGTWIFGRDFHAPEQMGFL